jgi:hypothetical protein
MFHPQEEDPDPIEKLPCVGWLRSRGVIIPDVDESDEIEEEDYDPNEPVFAPVSYSAPDDP